MFVTIVSARLYRKRDLQSGRYEKYIEVLKAGKNPSIHDTHSHLEFGERYFDVRLFKTEEGLGTVSIGATKFKPIGRELWKAKELLEKMFSSIHIMFTCMDSEFNFMRVNRPYAEANGLDPEFFVGKNHFDLFPYAENEDES